MRKTFLCGLIFFSGLMVIACQPSFLDSYDRYQEPAIKDRRFKHATIKQLILALPDSLFEVEQAGQSIEGREIYLVKIGSGNQKVLLWSQMHGNEPTATMAIMDIFNYLNDSKDPLRNQILKDLTLYFIPMLNPDGADKFQRRNAIDIDINRDALRLQSPESQILKEVCDRIEPEWGFNLHDQNHYSSAGKTEESASISFLAPAFNEKKEWNAGRTKAMQLICHMNKILQQYIPNKVGRYSDEFEPRAFGDNIQRWGTNTILIETGGLDGDPEKQYLRKLNYEALLQAFISISKGSYSTFSLKDYNKIPYNQSVLHDLIIRNAEIEFFGQSFKLDLGIRKTEVQDDSATTYYLQSQIVDQGDLHNYFGYEAYDAEGLQVKRPKIYPRIFEDLTELSEQQILTLLEDEYAVFKLKKLSSKSVLAKLPFEVVRADQEFTMSEVKLGQNPVLTFWKEQQLEALLVNGVIYKLQDNEDRNKIENWFSELTPF